MRRTVLVSIVLMVSALPGVVGSATDRAPEDGAEATAREPFIGIGCDARGIGMANPAALYCESLGHDYLLIEEETGQVGICIMPDGQQCKEWAFYSGACGKKFSYCALKGYEVETRSDGKDPLSKNYAVCRSPQGEKIGRVSDLMDLSEKATAGRTLPEPLEMEIAESQPLTKITLPSSFNWRSHDGYNWMTTVKNQGKCGSCWAFASVAVMEGVYNIAGDDPNLDLNLSEQYLVSDCFARDSCCGGWHGRAFDYVKTYGISDETCFPYGDADCTSSCFVGAVMTLNPISDPGSALRTLRMFRDQHLSPGYVDHYYEYAGDIKQILLTEPILLAEAGEILVGFLPAVRFLIGDEGGENLVIDASWVSKVVSFLGQLRHEIEERSDGMGAARAFELGRHLEELEFYASQSEGLDFDEAFRNSIYSSRGRIRPKISPPSQKALKCDCNCAYESATQNGYICSDRTCSDRCSDWSSRLWKIAQIYDDSVVSSPTKIKQYLIQKGPLAVAMGINDDFEGYWDDDNIYRCKKAQICGGGTCTTVNHAVVIVGYNDPGSYWVVRNSWGSGWEDKGYFKVGYGECAIEDYVYAISVNRPPVADAGGPYTGPEGSPITFNGSGSTDPDGNALQYRWDFDGNGSFDTGWSSSPTATHSWADNWGGMAKLEVSDSRLTDDDWTSVTVSNVAPSVSATGATISEGDTADISATFTDPGTQDTHTATVDWGDGSPVETVAVNQGAGSGDLTASHTYADNGAFTVAVTVTDNDGDSGTATATVTVLNVAPTVSATGATIPEGGTATIGATFTDPGIQDTHTATVDWGDGSPTEAVGVIQGAGSGSLSALHMYGDNGIFTVTVNVIDDDGGIGTAFTAVTVLNLAPTMILDTTGAIAFAGGNAFVGRLGKPQTHQASADDEGSDDLSFSWNFGSLTTYFNDGASPDPFPSPWGLCPFQAADSADVTFTVPGMQMIEVSITDDDGGICSGSMPKIVTGGCDCSRSQGYWKHQFKLQGNHLDETTLQGYLDLVGFASAVFSELVPADDLTEAYDAMWARGPSKRDKANAQALAAWLNAAHGCVSWGELIDTNGDNVGDTAFLDVMEMVEEILLDNNASHKDLVQAKDLAEAINLHDHDNSECAD